ncbi:hypothetical protein [Azospirillum canadense]|uniref:hypothetical protein n=1 Tax=Azospirillum canadense TaxID=403962 RepID=UPI002227F262|nr:hypothetical protein [Azospirillum canadense]MCW2239597.1 hypothetical protein [Azospirillum canadense]
MPPVTKEMMRDAIATVRGADVVSAEQKARLMAKLARIENELCPDTHRCLKQWPDCRCARMIADVLGS